MAGEREPDYKQTQALSTDDRVLVNADVVWIAYDVPLDDDGAPETVDVEDRIYRVLGIVPNNVPIFVSCQWPVGTTRRIAQTDGEHELIYIMENVRVGKAVKDFSAKPLPLVGAKYPYSGMSRTAVRFIDETGTTAPTPIMLWETAEMAKHATNAFMALQIAFANEIADICESVKADAYEVMSSVMEDARVSPLAPLKPGKPFGGGSLQRDLLVLESMSSGPILHAIRESNDSRS